MATTIDEFLVSLGFAVKEEEQKKFKAGLADAEKGVADLGSSLLKTASIMGIAGVGLEFGLKEIAKSWSDVFYQSQRTGETVANIKSFQYGMRAAGVDADKASAAFGGFVSVLQSNMGKQVQMEMLTGLHGQAQQTTAGMLALIKALHDKYPEAVAIAMAKSFNIDQQTYLDTVNNLDKVMAEQAKWDAMMKKSGADLQARAATFNEYYQHLSSIGAKMSEIGAALAEPLARFFMPGLQETDDLLTKIIEHEKTIKEWFDWFTTSGPKFSDLPGFLNPNAAGPKLKEGAAAVEHFGPSFSDLPGYLNPQTAGTAMRNWWNSFGSKTPSAAPSSDAVTPKTADPTGTEGGGGSPFAVNIPSSSRLSKANNNPGNLRFAGQAGAVEGEKGFAKFATPEAGLAALRRQVALDTGRGETISEFVKKYAPPKENDTGAYTSQMAAALNTKDSTKLSELSQEDIVRFIAQKESGTKLGGAGGGRGAVTNNFSTTINTTSNDPNAIGRATYDANKRLTQDAAITAAVPHQ